MNFDFLKQKSDARLFPVLSETSKEGRTLSVFLSCISLIPEFAAVLFSSIGQRIGNRTRIHCFTEVIFKSDDKSIKDRPDGLITLDTGRSTWHSLIEAKVGRNELTTDQISKYCGLARQNNLNSIITISNQFTPIPTHHPIKISKRDQRKVNLYHWSWSFILTQARLLANSSEEISDIQRKMLLEFTNFLQHPSSGVRSFDRMNPEWKDVVDAVKHGQPLRVNDEGVQNTVSSWEQEVKDLSLKLSDAIQTNVKIRILRGLKLDPQARLKASIKSLCENNALSAEYEIPDAASPLLVTADIAARVVTCAMRVSAPLDMKRAQTRVGWLKGQLKSASADTQLRAIWPGGKRATYASLGNVRDDNASDLIRDSRGTAPTAFEVSSTLDLGNRFAGVSLFITELEAFVIGFYESVGQNLKNWQPSAPKVKDITVAYDISPEKPLNDR